MLPPDVLQTLPPDVIAQEIIEVSKKIARDREAEERTGTQPDQETLQTRARLIDDLQNVLLDFPPMVFRQIMTFVSTSPQYDEEDIVVVTGQFQERHMDEWGDPLHSIEITTNQDPRWSYLTVRGNTLYEEDPSRPGGPIDVSTHLDLARLYRIMANMVVVQHPERNVVWSERRNGLYEKSQQPDSSATYLRETGIDPQKYDGARIEIMANFVDGTTALYKKMRLGDYVVDRPMDFLARLYNLDFKSPVVFRSLNWDKGPAGVLGGDVRWFSNHTARRMTFLTLSDPLASNEVVVPKTAVVVSSFVHRVITPMYFTSLGHDLYKNLTYGKSDGMRLTEYLYNAHQKYVEKFLVASDLHRDDMKGYRSKLDGGMVAYTRLHNFSSKVLIPRLTYVPSTYQTLSLEEKKRRFREMYGRADIEVTGDHVDGATFPDYKNLEKIVVEPQHLDYNIPADVSDFYNDDFYEEVTRVESLYNGGDLQKVHPGVVPEPISTAVEKEVNNKKILRIDVTIHARRGSARSAGATKRTASDPSAPSGGSSEQEAEKRARTDDAADSADSVRKAVAAGILRAGYSVQATARMLADLSL